MTHSWPTCASSPARPAPPLKPVNSPWYSVIAAAPDWSLEHAAAEMSRRGIRHLAVYEGAELIGVLSMRDIVRVWTTDGATSGMTPD